MEKFANWSNGASAKEVQIILQNNFKQLMQQIEIIRAKKIFQYKTIDLNFYKENNNYIASILLPGSNILSIKFYDKNDQEIYFSYDIDSDQCLIISDILPKNTYCKVIYYE